MVTANKLEKDRIDKLMNLSNSELDDYIESLVLDAYKGINGGGVYDNPEMDVAVDKLDEIINITLQKFPNANIKDVVKDRKFRYMNLAYLSAIYKLENLRVDLVGNIHFVHHLMELDIYYANLKELLGIYYDNYSNYGRMENLLMDLSDDGLSVNIDIRNKYLFSKEYGINRNLMLDLDIKIGVIVESVLDKIAKMDEKYLVDNTDDVDKAIDNIHDNIKTFYKNSDKFEISAYKQCGLLDAELNAIKTIKNENEYYSKHYLEIKEKLLDLIDGNGFGELSAKKFEKYYKDTGVDFDEWMKKQPKYDVRNAKFIYPEISECEYLSLH